MDKTILLTGHTGFLGSYVYEELIKWFKVVTIGRNSSCDYIVDFRTWDGELILHHNIEAIVHVAGLAHGKHHLASDYHTVNARSVDYLKNLAVENGISNFILISSVSVYGKESGEGIKENSGLFGSTPYALSKIEAEHILKTFQDRVLILRLPLIIGKRPPGNLGKLIVSIRSGKHVFLIGNDAKKSVVRATDVAVFIRKWLANEERQSGTMNLCNQIDPTFNWIEETIAKSFDSRYRFSIPFSLIKTMIIKIHSLTGVRIPLIGKVVLPLTFSDKLARTTYNYESKKLTKEEFENDII